MVVGNTGGNYFGKGEHKDKAYQFIIEVNGEDKYVYVLVKNLEMNQ